MILHLDFETYSTVDINNGVYAYAENSVILIVAYAVDSEDVQFFCPCRGERDERFEKLLRSSCTVVAHNAEFEHAILIHSDHYSPGFERFECTMSQALTLGLPASLDKLAIVLNAAQKKDARGKSLIRKFCIYSGKNMHSTDYQSADFQAFIEYCKQDVEVERLCYKKMKRMF